MPKENREELLSLLKNESVEATGYYDTELAQLQADALDAYFCRPYGQEEEGRSKFVTSEVADKVNWMMPALLRIFARNDDLITIDPTNEKDEENAKDAADYLDHVLFNDNNFGKLLGEFAKDGLINKIGVCETSWVEDNPEAPKDIKNVPPEKMLEYYQDEDYEIQSIQTVINNEITIDDFDEEAVLALIESGQDVLFNIKAQNIAKKGRVVITVLKPEDFLISKLATSIEDAVYVASREAVYKSELAKQFPKLKDEIMSASTDFEMNDIDNDERTQSRFYNESYVSYDENDQNYNNPRGTLHKEFIRFDYDGDDYVELLHVKRIGDVILEIMPVDESNFSSWCPIPVPHKFYGQSVAEITQPLQYVKTVLFRSGVDNVIASSRPQHAVNLDALSDEGLDQLYEQAIGSPIYFDGSPDIQTIGLPDMSGSVMGQLELTDRMLDARTGIKSDAMGVDTTSVHNTASGQEMLVDASDARKEDIAFQLGLGVEDIARKAYKLLCRNQDYKRQLKIKGKWTDFDPSGWCDDMGVTIHAGMSAGNKKSQISSLMNILQIQQTAMAEGGADNQWVTPDHINNTLSELTKASGYANSELFFSPVPTDEEKAERAAKQQAADPRTPEQIEADGKVQLKLRESEAESMQDLEQMRSTQKIKAMEAKSDTDRKDYLAASEVERKDVELTADLTLKTQQLNAELAMKQGQTVAEFKLGAKVKKAEFELNKDVKKAEFEHKVNLTDVHVGGDASK